MAATSTARSSKQLMRVLATPSRVANALDWKRSTGGAVATLDVHADRIGVRISRHPIQSSSSSSSPSESMLSRTSYHSFPLSFKGRSKIPESTRQGLSDLIHRYGVCGFVVSWPVQDDTGLQGAACGRTIFALEELLQDQGGNNNEHVVFEPGLPICLWDGKHHVSTADAFGRSPTYARISDKTEHVASKEQYHQDESVVASSVWEDFVRTHWPEIDLEYKQLNQSI